MPGPKAGSRGSYLGSRPVFRGEFCGDPSRPSFFAVKRVRPSRAQRAKEAREGLEPPTRVGGSEDAAGCAHEPRWQMETRTESCATRDARTESSEGSSESGAASLTSVATRKSRRNLACGPGVSGATTCFEVLLRATDRCALPPSFSRRRRRQHRPSGTPTTQQQQKKTTIGTHHRSEQTGGSRCVPRGSRGGGGVGGVGGGAGIRAAGGCKSSTIPWADGGGGRGGGGAGGGGSGGGGDGGGDAGGGGGRCGMPAGTTGG